MPCPHSTEAPSRGVDRRDFVKAAVAIGGAGALSACVCRGELADAPQGSAEGVEPPIRQHAWNEYLPRDEHGNTVSPYHQVILLFEYASEGVPEDQERTAVEDALTTVDRAYQWGNGGADPQQPEGGTTDGVLATMGYSRRYFDRFAASLPASVDLPRSVATLEELGEDRSKADRADAALLLSSDYGHHLLATEAALFGRTDELNGVSVEGSLEDAFDLLNRRTGFIGSGVPRERLDREAIPESSPLTMGFESGFEDNQASEDSVTISEGPFEGGTTQHVSRLRLGLNDWYANDHTERVHRMFSPDHTEAQVGETGEFLADGSEITEELADRTGEYAEHVGVVGHTQKTARARTDGFEPRILRRSEAMQTDREGAGFNFTSVQRAVTDFVKTRQAMNGEDLNLADAHSGILDHVTVVSRGNYLLPPRPKRALPTPRPS